MRALDEDTWQASSVFMMVTLQQSTWQVALLEIPSTHVGLFNPGNPDPRGCSQVLVNSATKLSGSEG